MKQIVVAWSCLLLTFLCSLRACHLYWSSTVDFRSTEGLHRFPWSLRHNRNKTELEQRRALSSLAATEAAQQQSILALDNDYHPSQHHRLDDRPDGLFYFTQVNENDVTKYGEGGGKSKGCVSEW